MKYDAARLELRRILNEQQTVSIPKLKRLLQSMNVSLKDKTPRDIEVKYLKGEIAKLKKRKKNIQGGIEMNVILNNGEVFTLDNEMKTSKSCTEWDVERFKQEGVLVELIED